MINLLPPELKKDYRYARYNQGLIRWGSVFLLAIFGVAVMTASGLFIMNNSMNNYKTTIASGQLQLASENITSVRQQVTDISNNLNLMVKVLSQEILFSKLLDQLAIITPPNVILTTLSISQSQNAINITAQTTDYNAGSQLQINLADPLNQIFSKADILDISCLPPAQAINPSYPCTADIRAEFTKNNPFLFINSKVQNGSS
jgi:Tfp pilus assembly protein PilN